MYGGAPVFYPQAGLPTGGRQPYVYPQGMIPPGAAAAAAAQTRRWTGQPGGAGRPQSFAPAPNFSMGGQPRQPRQGGGSRGGASSGGRGGANMPVGQVGGAPLGSRAPTGGNARRGGGPGNVPKYHNAGGLPAAGGRRPDGMIPTGAPLPLPVEAPPTADSLTHRLGASPEERKQLLGDNLFPLIHAQQPQYAAKLTGMILESTDDLGELLHLLEDSAALNEKVTEAFGVLSEHLKNATLEGGAAPAAAESSAEHTA